jgi:hypothetical protein
MPFGAIKLAAALGAILIATNAFWYARVSAVQVRLSEQAAAYEAERAVAATALAAAHQAARETEHRLGEAIAHTRKAHHANVAAIERRHAAVVDGLRERPDRPPGELSLATPPACASGDGGWATGARLYRADGEFLVGEAAAAARLQSSLQSCVSAYEAARTLIGEISQ